MLDAEEDVTVPLSIAGKKPDKAWLDDLLERTGLNNRRSHRPSELSGGQQQRVAIARALVTRPTIVFAEEPTGNLDSKTSGEILELVRSMADEYGQTTVMDTHEARAARCRGSGGRRRWNRPHRRRRQGRPLRRRPEPRLQRRPDPGCSEHAHARGRGVAGPERGRDRRVDGAQGIVPPRGYGRDSGE